MSLHIRRGSWAENVARGCDLSLLRSGGVFPSTSSAFRFPLPRSWTGGGVRGSMLAACGLRITDGGTKRDVVFLSEDLPLLPMLEGISKES